MAELRISLGTAHKLAAWHGLQADDVREAVQCVGGLPFVWDDDAERGLRAIVHVRVKGRLCDVVLYPAGHRDDDVWNLGSAYPM